MIFTASMPAGDMFYFTNTPLQKCNAPGLADHPLKVKKECATGLVPSAKAALTARQLPTLCWRQNASL
jgi:hypothetical protein